MRMNIKINDAWMIVRFRETTKVYVKTGSF